MAMLAVPESIPEEDDLCETWSSYREKAKLEVREFTKGILLGVEERKAELDRSIQEKLEHWKLGRIGRVEKNILRLSLFEIIHRKEIPYNVAINEAVELAKRYGDRDAGKFINGILGTWAPTKE